MPTDDGDGVHDDDVCDDDGGGDGAFNSRFGLRAVE